MSFKDIKGQDRPIQILREYIKHSRLTGSYLFAGEDGIGKKLVAKTLAKALNCAGRALDSCDSCVPCLKIEKGQHPDIHIIDSHASSDADLEGCRRTAKEDSASIKIEDIRQLQKDIHLKPYEGKQKVFIIDNAHNLTAEAGNALLKILEEPPPESLIILLSAKPALLFKTIISRCKMMKFYPLQRAKLEEILKEDFHLDNNPAHFLAYSCEGRIGRALKIKDIDILSEKNRIIDAFTPHLWTYSKNNKKNEYNKGAGFTLLRRSGIDRLSIENRNSVRAHLNILAGWFRDMYLIKIGAPCRELINLDRKEELLRLIQRYTFTDLYEILNSISNSLFYLERNVNIKLLLSNLRT